RITENQNPAARQLVTTRGFGYDLPTEIIVRKGISPCVRCSSFLPSFFWLCPFRPATPWPASARIFARPVQRFRTPQNKKSGAHELRFSHLIDLNSRSCRLAFSSSADRFHFSYDRTTNLRRGVPARCLGVCSD